jgi:hypothetical protein
MHLDSILVRNTFLNQEFKNVASVITLQLDDGAPLVMLHSGPVAAPGFLEVTDDLLKVKVFWQTLNQGETLASSTLLKV